MERIFFCGECRKFFYVDCEPTVFLCTCSHCGSVLTITCNLDKVTYNRYEEQEKNFFKNKIKDAYPDLESIMREQNYYRQRIDQMEEEARIRREELVKIYNIPITTGDLKQDYEVIGPVFYHIRNRANGADEMMRRTQQYHNEISDIHVTHLVPESKINYEWTYSSNTGTGGQSEILSMIATQELKKRAHALGADAIICMRQEVQFEPGITSSIFLQMYGTAVRFL